VLFLAVVFTGFQRQVNNSMPYSMLPMTLLFVTKIFVIAHLNIHCYSLILLKSKNC